MKPIHRLSGMASVLLLVSIFSPAQAASNVQSSQRVSNDLSVEDRMAAVHQRLNDAKEQLSDSDQMAEAVADLVAQWGDWYDWGDWGDWGDWVDWSDWSDWVDWGDWADWGDFYDSYY
jgi:hypothetical protein